MSFFIFNELIRFVLRKFSSEKSNCVPSISFFSLMLRVLPLYQHYLATAICNCVPCPRFRPISFIRLCEAVKKILPLFFPFPSHLLIPSFPRLFIKLSPSVRSIVRIFRASPISLRFGCRVAALLPLFPSLPFVPTQLHQKS